MHFPERMMRCSDWTLSLDTQSLSLAQFLLLRWTYASINIGHVLKLGPQFAYSHPQVHWEAILYLQNQPQTKHQWEATNSDLAIFFLEAVQIFVLNICQPCLRVPSQTSLLFQLRSVCVFQPKILPDYLLLLCLTNQWFWRKKTTSSIGYDRKFCFA